MRARGALGWAALAVAVLLVALVVSAPSPRSDRPLDPRATGPEGARALVLLLGAVGADVSVAAGVDERADTALVLEDRLDDDARSRLLSWVRSGGVLVVADPFSPLADEGRRAPCPVALSAVEALSFAPGAAGEIERDPGCYEQLVAAAEVGDGDIVAVRSARPFTNQLLGEADNAVLAAALLAPTGEESVRFVHGATGSGDKGLFDLLGPRTAQGIGQLALALVVYVLWRARRLGRVVAEDQPVQVAGSELVASVGRMLGSRRRPGEAAARVRADLRRTLERRLGLPPGGPIEPLALAVAGRTGLDPGWVTLALHARPVTTDDELVAVVADLDRIRDLILQPIGGARS